MTADSHPKERPEDVILRQESQEDEAFLRTLYASIRQEELESSGWTPEQRQAFLTLQFEAQKQGYRTAFPDATFSTILKNGNSAGRIIIHRKVDELRIVDMALLPEFRNQGIGTQLILDLQNQAAQSKCPLRLRVHPGSRAVRLYERLGFRKLDDDSYHRHYEWRNNPA
jgi:ribosomal protein S18 acetylase RimI-like enzyme